MSATSRLSDVYALEKSLKEGIAPDMDGRILQQAVATRNRVWMETNSRVEP